jgi:glycosyltransferase involved in cell wall biosynthesis
MKIVLDFRKYDGVIGGVERGVLEIVRYVAQQGHEIVILPKESRLQEVKGRFEGIPNLKFIPLQVRSHVMSLRNVVVDSVTIQRIAEEEEADAIHFPYNWSFPLRKSKPSILTIHDVIPLNYREAMPFFTNYFLYRPGIRMAGRLNDRIATVSEFSKRDISEKIGVPLSKITVVPNGLRQPFETNQKLEAELQERFQLQDGFILYVGGIHERKNVARLIQAFARLVTDQGFPGKLLATGSMSGAPYQDKMKAILDAVVEETGMGEKVIFTGFVTDEELEALMRKTHFMIYPSLYEGFGMPLLEAMQVGTPVITSNLTAMPEVAGGAALLVDPFDVEDIVKAMVKLLGDSALREEMIYKGKEVAKAYSWKRTAEGYLELYQAVCCESRIVV